MSSDLRSIRNRLAGLLRDVDALLANEPATSAPAVSPEADLLFESWWKNYPLKAAKGGARAAFKTASKKASHEELVAGLERYKFSKDRKYLPMATTWLNQERWADEQTSSAKDNNPLDGLDDLWG